MVPRRLGALLLVVLVGCSGPQRFIRLETDQEQALLHVPRAHAAPPVKVALPPGAVAMAAQAGRGGRTEQHHIATIANDKSTARGGPWSPRFRELFDKAGMELDDPANRMPLQGHKGPHPERYHEIVYDRLDRALASCRSIAECRGELTNALGKLAKEITTPGSELNRLLTQGKPR